MITFSKYVDCFTCSASYASIYISNFSRPLWDMHIIYFQAANGKCLTWQLLLFWALRSSSLDKYLNQIFVLKLIVAFFIVGICLRQAERLDYWNLRLTVWLISWTVHLWRTSWSESHRKLLKQAWVSLKLNLNSIFVSMIFMSTTGHLH